MPKSKVVGLQEQKPNVPKDAHYAMPVITGHHTVEECDVILQRRALMGRTSGRITDAWLEERFLAQEKGELPNGQTETSCDKSKKSSTGNFS